MEIVNTNMYERSGFGALLKVIPAGEFDDDNGRKVAYSRGIKLQVGQRSIKVNALQALAFKEIFNDPLFLSAINLWALEEKKELEEQMSMIKKL